MTTQEKLQDMLYQYGIFEGTCEKIVEKAKGKFAELLPAHTVDMNGNAEGYPAQFYDVVFETVIKPSAAEWFAENQPQHFLRSYFSGQIKL